MNRLSGLRGKKRRAFSKVTAYILSAAMIAGSMMYTSGLEARAVEDGGVLRLFRFRRILRILHMLLTLDCPGQTEGR